MKNLLPVTLLILIATLISWKCKTIIPKDRVGATILMDTDYLAKTKTRTQKYDPKLLPAFDQLIKDAEWVMLKGPFSVTDKEKLPPSGDPHDYASYSRYWWPDPNQPDGLPYIRRDGETNPDSQSPLESDRKSIGALGKNVETLGLAYFLTEEGKYAKKAAELLRIWFLDARTRMNPNLNHGQCRPGHNDGTKSGVLDGRLLVRALEGSLLISGSTELSDTERKGLKSWAEEYLVWLTTNELALAEAASKNNHDSWYDVQAIYFALYTGNQKAATQLANNFLQNRVYMQIQPDGSMPEEMARTRPLFYSIYNLHAMFLVASLAEKVGVDVWQADHKDARLRVALDYLVPYSDPQKSWPTPTLKPVDRMQLFPILQMADRAYPDGDYLKNVGKFPLEQQGRERINLTGAEMR